MKCLITVGLFFFSCALLAQQKQLQFMLIVRSKADIKAAPAQIKNNIAHWQAFMEDLGKNGKIAAGYRPATDGLTLIGVNKVEKPGAYVSSGEVISSFFIINAGDMKEAKQIAEKCPVYELQGTVEIRPLQNSVD